MNYIYKNKYGQLELEVIGPYQDVTKMKSKEFDDSCFFGIAEAEKIALITDNCGIQLSFSGGAKPDINKGYMLHHESSGIAALCRIVSLNFDKEINATKALDYPRSGFYGEF